MDNPMEMLDEPSDPFSEAVAKETPVTPETQKVNAQDFDLPIPGQSLTSDPGKFAYEQPPQFSNLAQATDYMFERITQPGVQRDILRLLDAGVPVSMLLEPIMLQGVNTGKFNMDLALIAANPLATMIGGLGMRAGIDVVWAPKKKDDGIDPTSFKKAFKDKAQFEKSSDLEPSVSKSMVKKSLLGKN